MFGHCWGENSQQKINLLRIRRKQEERGITAMRVGHCLSKSGMSGDGVGNRTKKGGIEEETNR